MLKPAFGLAAGLAALASLPLAATPAAADWTYGRSYAAPARPVMRLAPAYVRAPDGRPYGWDYYASPYSWAPYPPPPPPCQAASIISCHRACAGTVSPVSMIFSIGKTHAVCEAAHPLPDSGAGICCC